MRQQRKSLWWRQLELVQVRLGQRRVVQVLEQRLEQVLEREREQL